MDVSILGRANPFVTTVPVTDNCDPSKVILLSATIPPDPSDVKTSLFNPGTETEVPLEPLVPLVPDVPLVPLVPEVPFVPLVPLVPLVPDVPLVPLVPDVPLVIAPPLNKFVPTPAAHAVISIKAPLAVPPCSKNLTLFCHTSKVTPLPAIEVFVTGLFNSISPPSSPA